MYNVKNKLKYRKLSLKIKINKLENLGKLEVKKIHRRSNGQINNMENGQWNDFDVELLSPPINGPAIRLPVR